MALYVDRYTLATDATFVKKVEIGMVLAAVAVGAEGSTTFGRQQLRQRILGAPSAMAPLFARAVMADPTVQGTAPTGTALTDAQLQTAIDSVYNDFIGV